jgi:hypothetical protein
MRIRTTAFLLTMLLPAAVLAPVSLRAGEPVCDRSGSKSTLSPDGRWVANVQEEVCATETGAAAGITVVLMSTKDPTQSHRVFIMPVPGSRDDWPRIRWQAPEAMEVRVPNLTDAAPPEPAFAGIRITLTYCGDNPSDRTQLAEYKLAVKQWQRDVTAWAQQRKQDPASVGPRPPRPEEPRLASGRCTD